MLFVPMAVCLNLNRGCVREIKRHLQQYIMSSSAPQTTQTILKSSVLRAVLKTGRMALPKLAQPVSL